MKEIVILDAIRTPIGKYKGALSSFNAVDLGVKVTKELIQRNLGVSEDIKQVIFGNVLQAGNGQNPARQIALKSGLNHHIVASTINEVCGSGLKAIMMARQLIQLGEAEVVLAGGTESMSQAPKISAYSAMTGEYGQPISSMILDGLTDAFSEKHMGLTAEKVAEQYGITRQQQDEFALNSQMKAAQSKQAEAFAQELVSLEELAFDEGIREGSTLEKLASLQPVFKEDGSVTAGNASTLNDGSAAVLLASKEYAIKHNLPYLAVIKDCVEVGIDPSIMGISPIKAISELLERNQLTKADIDLFEINEAFAASSIVVEQELGLDANKVNVLGGGISLGHPIGATGARLVTTLSYQLAQADQHLGIASLCVGGGLGVALLLERPAELKKKDLFTN